MSQTTNAAPPPVAAVQDAVAADAVLRTAEQLELLAALTRGPMTADEIAEGAGYHADAVAVVLDALVALGLAEQSVDGYLAHAELPSLVTTMRAGLATLPERVRTGKPRLAGDRPVEAGQLYSELAAPLGALFAAVAEEVADRLAAPGLSVLDVGAGAAPWTRAIARRDRRTHVVACDLAPVLPAAHRAIVDDGLVEQFDLVARDVLADPLPGRHDLVVAANLCHLFDTPTAQQLIRRLAGAARPGGTVAIIDAVPEHEDSRRQRSIALYAASLLTRTASGRVHTFAQYRLWLEGAGCRQVTRHDCARFPTSLVTGRVS